MTTDKERSEIQESLLHLYLRLNGYFLSGFIAHSKDKGKILAQIDALAVRHPFNGEPKREIGPSPFLNPKGTDLLVCEVKSGGMQLQFNDSFRDNDVVIQDVLRWAGLFDEDETLEMARAIKPLLQPGTDSSKAARGVPGPRGITARPLLCSPEQESPPRNNQPWFLGGDEMFRYIAECVNPKTPRPDCATQYDTTQWGSALTPLVRYFKGLPPGTRGGMQELYEHLEQEKKTKE